MTPSSSRWTFVALLGAATFINYLDRGSLAVALPIISKDLGLGPEEQGLALSAFFWTYTAMQIPVGRFVDRHNIKYAYAAMFALWSLAAAATGLVTGLAGLLVCRVLLGIGEQLVCLRADLSPLVVGELVAQLFNHNEQCPARPLAVPTPLCHAPGTLQDRLRL